MSSSTRWFRRLLRLLPADFQADYARDMERTFRAQERDAREHGALGMMSLWLATIGGLLRTAPREHLEQLAQDVSYAVRNLRGRPGVAAAGIATLALGIGSVTAILSIVNTIDWRPLAYPEPDRVVFVQERFKGEVLRTTSYATFADWRDRVSSFEALAAVASREATLASADGAERVAALGVTPDFFRVTGMPPSLGRGFTDAQNRWSNRRFVILSARLWRSRFSSDTGIVGRAVDLNGHPHVVVGVMPDGVEDLLAERLYDRADLWVPLAYDASLPSACRTCRHLRVVGRLRSGISTGQAAAEVEAVTQQLAREHPTSYADPGGRVERVADVLLGPVRPALYLLLAAVGVLLLIAVVNVANLQLVRAVERGPEIATRRAIGIASTRLLRQLLTESLVLAAAGGICGLACAHAALRALVMLAPASIPRIEQVAIDGRVLAATTLITAGVGLAFGMLPAWHLASADLVAFLRGARSLVSAGGRVGRTLVAVNVALAVVLLAVTGLLGRSFLALLRVDPGFDPRHVMTASLSLAGPAYAEGDATKAFHRTLLERIIRSGDVAALTTQLPTNHNDSAGFHIEGRAFANPEDAPMADRFGVTPAYFHALRIPVLRGRAFTEHDDAASPRVAIINHTAAQQRFPGEDPIGKRISLGAPTDPPREIIGIVGDIRHRGLSEAVSFQAYVPLAQLGDWPVWIVLRTSDADRDAVDRIARAVAALDKSQVAHDVRSFEAVVRTTLAERRFLLALIGTFAGAALMLAVIGLYGVVSYVVVQRTRDLGLRVALGAGRGDISRLVLRIGMVPVTAGISVGLLLVVAATRPVERMLFGVQRLDGQTIAGAAAVLFASALLACYVPARRATRLDPVSALRAE